MSFGRKSSKPVTQLVQKNPDFRTNRLANNSNNIGTTQNKYTLWRRHTFEMYASAVILQFPWPVRG